MSSRKKKILIAAGGTGGHIFPALRVAECMQTMSSNIHVEFVHGGCGLERHIYSKYSFVCHVFSIGRLRKGVPLMERMRTIFYLPLALIRSIRLVSHLQADVVFGTGGAVSGVILAAAILLRKKTVIWEPNVIPGLANRFLSRIVSAAIIVCRDTKSYIRAKKIMRFSFPVRKEIRAQQPKPQSAFTALKVLVLGGSQGSSTINQAASELIFSDARRKMSFVHQTGKKEFSILRYRYQKREDVRVFSFLKDVHEFYHWADIVIARAGMGTIAELSYAKKAAILVPLASSAGGHQWQNAKFLEKHSAAVVIPQKELNITRLLHTLEEFQDSKKLNQLASNIHSMGLGSSGEELASYLISLV